MISCHLIGLRKTKTLPRAQKDQDREKWRRCRVESRSKDTPDTIESLRSIDLSTIRTCGKFHRRVVFFISLFIFLMELRDSQQLANYKL